MNRKEMLDKYGDIELVFVDWYKNTFTLKPLDRYEYSNLSVTFIPDYRDTLSMKEVTTIYELTELDDHMGLTIFDPEQIYYSQGEDIPISMYLEEHTNE